MRLRSRSWSDWRTRSLGLLASGRGPRAQRMELRASSIRRLALAISRFIPDPHRPAGLREVRGQRQAQGGRRLALPPPQGQQLPPSGLMRQPHLLKNELQVPSWGWGLEFWLGVGIPRSSLKRRSLPPGSRGGLGLSDCWLSFSACHPLPPGRRGKAANSGCNRLRPEMGSQV